MTTNRLPKIFALAFALLVGCGKQEGDKKAQLADLKKQQAEISTKIKTLEDQIEAEGGPVAENLNVKSVLVTPAKLQTFNHYVEIQGKVDSDKNIIVSSEASGNIQKVYVVRGDKVKRGQVLASVDNILIRKSIEDLRTSLELAKTIFEKQERLWKENVGTEVQYLQAKNTKEGLENKLDQLNEQLKKTKISASMDGVVDEVFKKEGEIIAPGTPAFRIVNFSEFKIVGELSESYISKINVGDEVEIFFPDLKKTITEKISVVGSTINPTNRTFTIELKLSAGKVNVKPNLVAYLRIKDFTKAKALVAPINTVQSSDEGQFIYLANGNKVEKRKVKIGETYGSNALILDGLKEGDKIITFGYSEVNEGQLIKY